MDRKKKRLNSIVIFGSLLVGSAACAQGSDIVYFNMRGGDNTFYTTTTCDFVGNSNALSAVPTISPTFAMDANADGTKIYAIEWTDGSGFSPFIWELDVASGVVDEGFGILAGPEIDSNISGMSFNAANGLWYLTALESGGIMLYSGDITTGVFTPVGTIAGPSSMIDISINSAGECFGHNHGDDMLYAIDLTDGTATVIGPTKSGRQFRARHGLRPERRHSVCHPLYRWRNRCLLFIRSRDGQCRHHSGHDPYQF